jgi:predicted RNase H-like nuclease (RuvC/YqgF family)
MTDIEERLRTLQRRIRHERAEAADEIERLESENRRIISMGHDINDENKELMAEIERLKAQVERLQDNVKVEANLRREFRDEVEELRAKLAEAQGAEERLRGLICTLLENDPNELAADGGITVLDVWRKEARAAIAKASFTGK